MNQRYPLVCTVLLLSIAAIAVPAQTFVYYPDDNAGANFSSPGGWYPWFTNTTGSRHQIQVPASFLSSVVGQPLSSIGVFLGNTNSGTSATYSTLQIRLGPAGASALTATFATNLVPGTETLVVDQPNTTIQGQGTAGAWVDLQFTQPYVYTGGDLIVDHQTQITGSAYHNSSVGTGVARCVAGTYTGQTTGTLSSSSGTKVRFGMGGVPVPMWQPNQPAADLTINVATGPPPLVTNLGVGQAGLMLVNSTQVGLPWDLAITLAAPVPLGGGALVLPDGQLINLDLGDPSLSFLSQTVGPIFFNGTLPIAFVPNQAFSLSAQSAHYDPTTATGLSFSAVNQLVVQ